LKFITLFCFFLGVQKAQAVVVSTSSSLPAYSSLLPDINQFNRFADGGPDGNWYIGFNNAWIVKLDSAPLGQFSRAFIGAKIGRAKTQPNPDKPWERDIINGKVYMAISNTPSFSSDQSYFLAETKDIPVDPDSLGTERPRGSARWFWAEVPVSLVSFTQPNYLVIWSPTSYFTSVASSPVLAAGTAQDFEVGHARAWNNRSIVGVPPRSYEGALETPINIAPALAIKLVGPGAIKEVSVKNFSIAREKSRVLARFSVSGRDFSQAWVESSDDQLNWERVSPFLTAAPFYFSLDPVLVKTGNYLRGAADDESGDVGFSDPFQIP
jgi:hypothetical protein